jgi:hypothetical protein
VAWYVATAFGTLGGLVVSLVAFFNDLWAWREARRAYMLCGRSDLPDISQFIDLRPDLLVLMTRMIFGALTGWLVHAEVTGFLPVIAAGASAPAILSQFGKNPAYGAGLEIDPPEKAGHAPARATTPESGVQPAGNTNSKERANYQGRHAKIAAASSGKAGPVPHQRVQPEADLFTTPGD